MASDESEFPRVFRGYDQDAVDRSILRLRRELLAAKTEADRLTAELQTLTEANQSLALQNQHAEAPSYASFGHAFERTLKAAETEAAAIRSRAITDAFNLKNATERERAQIIDAANEHSIRLLAQTEKRAAELLHEALRTAAETAQHAQARASELIAEAETDVANARRNSASELTRDRANARREIEILHAAAAREIAELKLVLTKGAADAGVVDVNAAILEVLRIDADAAAHRDDAEREYQTKHNEAVHNTELYLEQAQAELQALRQQISAAEKANRQGSEVFERERLKLQAAVDKRALALLAQAAKEAGGVTTAAQTLANDIAQRAEADAQLRLADVNAEREAVIKLLSDMTDAFVPAPAKPAYPADAKPTARRAVKPAVSKSMTANATKPSVKPPAVKAATAKAPAAKAPATRSSTKAASGTVKAVTPTKPARAPRSTAAKKSQ